jgi:3'-phosphoadenosine 5'-phosphosulfate sulfotransferase (PAPS reductase)/FAD synthetase
MDDAVQIIKRAAQYKNLTISFNGGKDCLAVLNLALKIVDKITCFFVVTDCFDEQLEFVKSLESPRIVVKYYEGLLLIMQATQKLHWPNLSAKRTLSAF